MQVHGDDRSGLRPDPGFELAANQFDELLTGRIRSVGRGVAPDDLIHGRRGRLTRLGSYLVDGKGSPMPTRRDQRGPLRYRIEQEPQRGLALARLVTKAVDELDDVRSGQIISRA